ncbi:MAG: hypothetical protein IKB50_00620 [Clostridia bacterium]|nr:hypothetical protein [Clostridia bacterium]
MKKILSMLLCALLVMSSMVTVAFADEAAAPATITFGEYLAQLPAGSKIIVNTGDVAEGNTVVATINGVAAPLTKADGYYAVTVPAGDNNISVAVKNGDTVVAQTATIKVFGLSYLGAGQHVIDTTFEPDATGELGNKFGYNDVGMKNTWYDAPGVIPRDVNVVTEGTNTHVQLIGWGGAIADPNSAEGYTKKAGANTEFCTNLGGYTGIVKLSVDWRADYAEIVDDTGAVVNTIDAGTADGFKAMAIGDAGVATTRNGNILGSYTRSVDTYDVDNDGDTAEVNRRSLNYWEIATNTGKPTFTAYAADGTPVKFTVDNYNDDWNNYSVIFDMPNNKIYGYINDIYVGSGCIAGFQLTRADGDPDKNKWVPAVVTSIENMSVGKTTAYNPRKVRTYTSVDNFMADVYDDFAPTEPAIFATNAIAETTLPAGTKMQIAVNAANIPAGCKAVANVNGVKTPITLVDGAYNYNAPLAAGYNSIRFEIVDANGDVAVYEGDELVSDEYFIFGLEAAGEVEVLTNDSFEDDVAEELKHYDYSESAYVEYKTAGGNTGKYMAVTNTEAGGAMNAPSTASGLGAVEFSADMRVEGKPEDQTTYSYFTGTAEGQFMNIFVRGTYTDGSTFREQVSLFGIPRYGQELQAQTRNLDGTTKKAVIDADFYDWHNYKAILDIESNTAYIYFDGEFVQSGYIFQKADKTVDTITSLEYAAIGAPRTYNGIIDPFTGANHQVTWGFDNVYLAEIGSFADAPTEAVVNAAITASGASLAIVPANLGLAESEVMDIAVVARTAAGAVEIQKYEDVTSESAYKAFAFDMADIEKVFVWDWATLAPIVDVIE